MMDPAQELQAPADCPAHFPKRLTLADQHLQGNVCVPSVEGPNHESCPEACRLLLTAQHTSQGRLTLADQQL